MYIKPIYLARAKKVAKRILRENKKGRSYRVIAREDYPTITPGTLNRFANGRGNTYQRMKNYCVALGLKKDHIPAPKSIWKKSTKELLWCLLNRKKCDKRSLQCNQE